MISPEIENYDENMKNLIKNSLKTLPKLKIASHEALLQELKFEMKEKFEEKEFEIVYNLLIKLGVLMT